MIVVQARLKTMDKSLEEAAMDLGATEFGAFRKVTPAGTDARHHRGGAARLHDLVRRLCDHQPCGRASIRRPFPMVIYTMARKGVSPAVNAMSALIVIGVGVLIVAAEKLQEQKA
jgi:ABC-type spermidine/putrescine transport system permease subunit II